MRYFHIQTKSYWLCLLTLFLTQTCAISAENTSKKTGSGDFAANTDVIVVADFRDSGGISELLQQPGTDTASTEVVDRALGSGASETFRLADSVNGSFTSAETNQILHVLVNKKFVSTASHVTPAIVVVFENTNPVTQFVMSDGSYTNVEAVLDVDGDGFDEVLLTAPMIHMGKELIGASLYGFKNPQELNRQKIGLVYESSCSVNEQALSSGDISATVITKILNDTVLQTEEFFRSCE